MKRYSKENEKIEQNKKETISIEDLKIFNNLLISRNSGISLVLNFALQNFPNCLFKTMAPFIKVPEKRLEF